MKNVFIPFHLIFSFWVQLNTMMMKPKRTTAKILSDSGILWIYNIIICYPVIQSICDKKYLFRKFIIIIEWFSKPPISQLEQSVVHWIGSLVACWLARLVGWLVLAVQHEQNSPNVNTVCNEIVLQKIRGISYNGYTCDLQFPVKHAIHLLFCKFFLAKLIGIKKIWQFQSSKTIRINFFLAVKDWTLWIRQYLLY